MCVLKGFLFLSPFPKASPGFWTRVKSLADTQGICDCVASRRISELIRGGPTRRDHVLPPVVTPGPPDPQTLKSSPVVQPLHVHGLLPAQLPVGEEAVYHLCLSLPGGIVSHLLQLLGKLLSVPLPRFSTAGLRTRPQHRGHLDSGLCTDTSGL